MLTFEEQQQNTSTLTELLWKPLTKVWQNSCLNLWMFKTLKQISAIWVKILDSIVSKMSNTKLSMIGMKSNDSVKLGIVKLDKSHSKENVKPEDD